MEFIERNSFDVRSAVFRLTHPQHPLVFELYPMVHLAEPAFYDTVAARLKLCDAILYEGVKSKTALLLAKAYEFAGGSSRLDLVTQAEALRLEQLPGTLINADVSGSEFDREWRQVPALHRILISSLAPFVGLVLRFWGTKRILAQGLQVDDRLCDEDFDNEESGWDMVDKVIVEFRDRHLISVLRKFFETHRSQPITVAVVFGGGAICQRSHMR